MIISLNDNTVTADRQFFASVLPILTGVNITNYILCPPTFEILFNLFLGRFMWLMPVSKNHKLGIMYDKQKNYVCTVNRNKGKW